MLRRPDDWSVEVFHGLEPLVHAWDRRGDDVTGAVLHVGFDRRPARHYAECADRHPDRLLLTDGARGTLPDAFRCSTRPVGTTEAGELLYVALEGWGYSIEDVAPPLEEQPLSAFGDWLFDAVAAQPDLAASLGELRISSDADYLAAEATLPLELRARLGCLRAEALVVDWSDPCAIVRGAPPWLRAEALDALPLTVRIGNVFRRVGIERVEAVGELTVANLLGMPNFGRTSIGHLADILTSALHAGPRPSLLDDPSVSGVPLVEAVRLSLAALPEREGDIMIRRMGLGQPSETLAQIGDGYGITRERIRQIEARVTAALVAQEHWDDLLAHRLRLLLTDREFPLPLLGVEALDPWFEGVATELSAFRYVLENMCDARVSLVTVSGVDYLAFANQEQWEQCLATAQQALAAGAEQRWSREEARRLVTALTPADAPEFGSLLWDESSKRCHFAGEGDGAELISFGRGADHVVEAVLHEAETPLHYSDLARLASERAGREIDERRAHNAAAEIAYLFGRGTFGLLHHLPIDGAQLQEIADEATEIVLEGPPGRQWHAAEILDLLRSRGLAGPEIDKYIVEIALHEWGVLHSLGRMVWAGDEQQGAARLDIQQAVISILHKAGRPLTSAELRQRLVAVRGINQGMQLWVEDPVIKLQSSLWGLNDRDLAVKRCDQSALLDRVAAGLRRLGRPVSILDSAALVDAAVPGRALFCLCAADARFATKMDRTLSLRQWECG